MYKNEYLSFDENTNLCVYLWLPETEDVKGVIQLAHGMAEHLGRYDEFGEYFKKLGYIVFGADHYAHGKSVKDIKDIGVVIDYDFIDAVHQSIHKTHEKYFKDLDVPHYLFSHSMGSMAAQSYIEKYPHDFSKVVLCGTDAPSVLYKMAKMLTKKRGRIGHIEYWSVAENLGVGSFNKKFKKENDPVAWLSKDLDNRRRYKEDELCGASFPTNYYYSLASSLVESKKKENRELINKDLKLLVICGALDPVGHFGKGPTKLNKQYQKMGLDSSLIIYDDARHEILNEGFIKDKVYSDLLSFFSK